LEIRFVMLDAEATGLPPYYQSLTEEVLGNE